MDFNLENDSRPWLVAVSGLMGSGKTTLARQIAQSFRWRYAPEGSVPKSYLEDLFAQPSRWAFEAQIAFLSSKALEIQSDLRSGDDIVIDRSLDEDVDIFAAYFRDAGYIDGRSFGIYNSLAGDFRIRLGPPDLMIYCHVSPKTASERLSNRHRGEERLYPTGHLEELASRYKRWYDTYNDAPLYFLDSESVDWTKPEVVSQICVEISELLIARTAVEEQLKLFKSEENPENSTLFKPRIGRVIHATPKNSLTMLVRNPDHAIPRVTRPSHKVYVAAPFTGQDTGKHKQAILNRNQGGLYEEGLLHGRISPGPYRKALVGITRALGEIGFEVILPHRDVNKWGDKELTAEAISEQCTRHVQQCDFFVGLLAQSCGSHYEFGLALGSGKPCIVMSCGDITESFIAKGVSILQDRLDLGRHHVLHVRLEKFSYAAKMLQSPRVLEFIHRHFHDIPDYVFREGRR